jgi:hypothetical protein
MRSLRPTTYNAFRPLFVLWAVLALGLLASVLYIEWYDLNNPTQSVRAQERHSLRFVHC